MLRRTLAILALALAVGCQTESTETTRATTPQTPGQADAPARPGDDETRAANGEDSAASTDEAPIEARSVLPQDIPDVDPVPAADAPSASPRLDALPARDELTKRITTYFDSRDLRRLYVQVDKPLYNPGETIWVRTWDVRARDLTGPESQDEVWYELVSPRGAVVTRHRVEPDAPGRAHHAFDLDEDAAGGLYIVRARAGDGVTGEREVVVNNYQPPRVKKELEFKREAYGAGDEVRAEVKVRRPTGEPLVGQTLTAVARVDGVELPRATATTDAEGKADVVFTLPDTIDVGDGVLTVLVDDGGATESITRRLPILLKKIDLDLYPEGGDLVAGLPSRVYFEARKPTTGKPADVSGRVVDDRGEEVARFDSHRDGFGRFELTPQPGRAYAVEITKPEGIADRHDLPAVQAEGCVLRSHDDLDGQLTALRASVRCTSPRQVIVTAVQRERLLDAAAVAVPDGAAATVHLEPDDAALTHAQGPARVTVFDVEMTPLAERLVYRNRRHRLQLEVRADSDRYGPRDQVTLDVTATDADGQPVAGADVALAVVDDRVISLADDKEPHLLASLLLTPELHGDDLDDPNFLLDLAEDESALTLDLVMGTRGWRRFEWMPVTNPDAVAADRDLDGLPETSGSTGAATPTPELADAFGSGVVVGGPDPAALAREGSEVQRGPIIGGRDANQGIDPGALNALLGAGVVASGSDAIGGDGEAANAFGLGVVGAGRGGGGSVGGFGVGGLEVGGKGIGIGHARGGRIGARSVRVPRVRSARPAVDGALDNKIIRRVVMRHRGEIKNCFNRELQKNPKLGGKITVSWVIGADGNVKAATTRGDDMGNARVANCLNHRVRRWRFPAPKGGGVVKVTYPFVFDSTDGGGGFGGRPTPPPPPPFVKARVFPTPDHSQERDPDVRDDFRETVFWAPTLTTDDQGKATASFYLSDAITSFRVTAEGVGAGAAGRDEMVFASKRLLSMDVKFPQAISAGDRVEVPLVVSNEAAAPVDVALTANVGDLLQPAAGAAPPDQLRVEAEARASVTLPFEVADDASGEVMVRFGAAADGRRDAFERSVRVEQLGFPVLATAGGQLAGQASHTFDLASAIDGSPRGELVIEPGVLATMVQGLEGMLREPSGCFEQTSSSNYPNTLILTLLQQRGDVARSETLAGRSRGLLDRGYKRLVGYESPGGGFEWFGRKPGHATLTAYGVLQFEDMKRVHQVDGQMLDRTLRWLLERRDGEGGYKPSGRALHSWATGPIVDAYITYALTEAGYIDRLGADSPEIQRSLQLARTTEDPYVLALAAATLFNIPGRERDASAAAARLVAMQQDDGGWQGKDQSITQSRGDNLHVETTALAIAALLDSGEHAAAVNRGVGHLYKQRESYGRFGATQATVLALKALVRYSGQSTGSGDGQSGPGAITVNVNDTVVATLTLDPGAIEPLRVPLGDGLRAGENTVTLSTDGGGQPLPYAMTLAWRSTRPADSPDAPIGVATALAADTVKLGESVRLTATVTNRTQDPMPMTLARVGLPGGLETQTWQLKELKDEGTVAFYETRPREVIAYLDSLAPGASVEIPIELTAAVPGRYTAPASQAYLYYTDNLRSWADPVAVTITR